MASLSSRGSSLTASLVNRSFLLAHGAPENFTHTFALGIVAHNCRGQLALRLEVPVDRAARADDRFVVGLEPPRPVTLWPSVVARLHAAT